MIICIKKGRLVVTPTGQTAYGNNLKFGMLTIIAQTICGLKEIAVAAIELLSKNQMAGSKYSNRTVIVG